MIDTMEADRLADMIANGTGRGWSDDAVKLLSDEIQSWTNPGAAYAAADAIARGWTDDWRPPLGVVIEKYNEAVAAQAKAEAKKGARERPQCDGTGWVEGIVPCRRCNPYLRDLFDDPPRWDQFMDGGKLSDLHDEVTLVDRKLVGARGMPTPCQPDLFHDPADRIISPAEGYLAARRGYEAECVEHGREPNWKYFDDMMSGLLRHAASSAEGPVSPPEPRTDTEGSTGTGVADAIAETKRRMDEDF